MLNNTISCLNIKIGKTIKTIIAKMTTKFICLLTIFTTFFLLNIAQITTAKADSPAIKQYNLAIENHRFKPEIIEVEANKPFELVITNRDKTVEEFESDALRK